jgi:hypothetical protein
VIRSNPPSHLDLYRQKVERLMAADARFEDLEEAIHRTRFSLDEKAELWLLAWSLDEPHLQRRRARATLSQIGRLPAAVTNGGAVY